MDSLTLLQEHGGYITDITRTWPISGTFTPAQKDLYEAVLTTQRQCISLCRANANVSLDELHNIAEADLNDNLKQLGFDMSGNVCVLPLRPPRESPMTDTMSKPSGSRTSVPPPSRALCRSRRPRYSGPVSKGKVAAEAVCHY